MPIDVSRSCNHCGDGFTVTFETTTWNELPYKFEAGTPNIAGAIGLGAAVRFLSGVGFEAVAAHERALLSYGTEALERVAGLRLIGTAREKASVLSFVGIVLVVSFFVTSSDSGSLVIDTITAGGKMDPPVAQRVFWAVFEGLVAMTLMLGGGLASLQAASIATGFPFTLVLLAMCYSTYVGLRAEQMQLARA